MQPLLPSATYTLPDTRYAVLLNANAGRVTPRLARAVRRVASPQRVHLSESPEHAREILHKCVEDEIGTVFAGGGGGTIVDVINTISDLRAAAPAVPSVGVLRLGTGNALAHWLGSGRPVHDLRRWRAGLVHRLVPLHMVEADGRIFPFAGLGLDAAIVNDYNAVKKLGQDRWWSGIASGLTGYLLSGYLRTLPNYLRRPTPRITVTNLGRPARRVGADGRPIGDLVDTGGVLYDGPASFLGCATTPLYGYGVRMFPHATARAGRFQLRIASMSAWQVAVNFPRVFKGTIDHPQIMDWWADRIRVTCEDAMPYQVGGDASGYRNEVVFSLNQIPIGLIGQA